MNQLEQPKEVKNFTLLLLFTYMISYLNRLNFGAVVSEMAVQTGISKAALSLSLTGSFIAYGAGQILSGVLGDRLSPKKMVSAGLATTVCMNLMIPQCEDPYGMLVVWCVNGLAQALLWPPMVRMMSSLLDSRDYQYAVTRVNWGGSFGTILVYLSVPVLITTMGWRSVFYFAGCLGFVMLILWNVFAKETRCEHRSAKSERSTKTAQFDFPPVLILVMFGIILHGMLRDGVTTWMPSLIAESFQLGNALSILTSVALPVFSILSLRLTQWLYQRRLQDPLRLAAHLFGLGALCAILLCVIFGNSVVATVLLAAVLTGCMHGINLLLVCMVPAYFKKSGNISTVSGLLNACTYIGSAISTYGVAAFSENVGWQKTIFLWFLIALLGCIICICCIKPWKKRWQRDEQ